MQFAISFAYYYDTISIFSVEIVLVTFATSKFIEVWDSLVGWSWKVSWVFFETSIGAAIDVLYNLNLIYMTIFNKNIYMNIYNA